VIGKGGKASTIPLSSELREILWPLKGDPTEYVFTYLAKATRVIHSGKGKPTGRSTVRGERYPITYSGFGTAWRRFGAAKAGVEDFRLHDFRHTAGTRLLRDGKAILKVVQKLLRHEDITSTMKYAHVFDEDVRAAMEAETKARQEVLQKVLQASEKTA
jgi:integrase